MSSLKQFFDSVKQSGLVKLYAGNSLFVTIVRCCWILQALTVGIYVTRVLGPTRLGEFNYSISVSGLISVFLMMQCNDVIIRHLVRHPQFENVYLGTNLVYKLIFLLFSALVLLLTGPFYPHSPEIRKMICISFLAQGVLVFYENIVNYFTASSKIRLMACSQLIACAFYSLFRFFAAWHNLSVYAYLWIEVINSVVLILTAFCFYQRNGIGIRHWKFDKRILKKISLCALPFFLASLTATFYARTDLLMLQAMKGAEVLGFYSLSARFTENMNLLLQLLISVFVPVLFLSANLSEEMFRIQFHRLYFLIFWTAATIVAATELLGNFGIYLLYGTAFLPTFQILRVFILSTVFFGLTNVFLQWAVKTNRLLLGGILNAAGLLINIPLNYILIKKYGGIGAAWATVLSGILGTILVLLCFPSGRHELWFMLKSAVTLPSFKFLK